MRNSLITAVLDCLEKPSQSECSLGAHIVEIIAFIMGPHQELFYSQVNKVLKPLVKSRSEEIQSAVRSKCSEIRALIHITIESSGSRHYILCVQ